MSHAETGPSFLRYLESLDAFLARRGQDDDDFRQDPDVARLVEAIAFFSQHAARHATHTVQDTVRQLACGPFATFDRPLPAQLMAVAKLGGQRLTPINLPASSLFEVIDGNDQRIFCSTTRALRILPLALEHAELRPASQGRMAIVLRLRARLPLDLSYEQIALHVQALGHAGASLRLLFLLRRHLRDVVVLPNHHASAWERGEPCGFAFEDAVQAAASANSLGPFEDLRRILAQPLALCTLRLALPALANKLETFELRLILDELWPAEDMVTARNFVLHSVPLENRFPGLAAPIYCDGTRDEFDVVAMQPADARLHHIAAVYEATKQGPVLIPPATLATSSRWWTERVEGDDAWQAQHILRLKLPQAFMRPTPITVHGQWMQPTTCANMRGPLRLALYNSAWEGLGWQTIATPTRAAASPIWQQPERVLQLMGWRTHRLLPLPALLQILQVLGIHDDHPLAALLPTVTDVRGEEVSDPQTGGQRLLVKLSCGEFADDDLGWVCLLLLVCAHVLRAWSPIPVDVVLAGNSQRALGFAPPQAPGAETIFSLASIGGNP